MSTHNSELRSLRGTEFVNPGNLRARILYLHLFTLVFMLGPFRIGIVIILHRRDVKAKHKTWDEAREVSIVCILSVGIPRS